MNLLHAPYDATSPARHVPFSIGGHNDSAGLPAFNDGI